MLRRGHSGPGHNHVSIYIAFWLYFGTIRRMAGMTFGTRAVDGQFADDGAAGRFPELDCVRAGLAPAIVRAAEDRAARLGVGADRVMVAAGTLDEDDYLRCLAKSLGVVFEMLDDMPRNSCRVSDERLIESAAAGLLPLEVDGELYLVVAPRGTAARRIITMIEDSPALAVRFRLTSAEQLTRFVLRCAGGALTARASNDLKQAWPALSAAPPRWRVNLIPLSITAAAIAGVVILAPGIARNTAELVLAVVFIAWLALRVCSAIIHFRKPSSTGELSDHELPVYTIMAALYKEAASVDGLLRAIEKLDYPGIR
jgi:hypothetical protein